MIDLKPDNASRYYKYKPSYIVKEGSRYAHLNKTYHKLFEKYIASKGKLTEDENLTLWNGILELSNYVVNSFYFLIFNDYSSKTNRDRVISAMYYRLSKAFGDDYIEGNLKESISSLAENSVLMSLGMMQYKKNLAFKWSSSSKFPSIIKHTIEVVFKALVFDYLSQEVESVNASVDLYDIEAGEYTTEDKTAEELVELSGVTIPSIIKGLVIEFLDGGELSEKEMKNISPYLDLIGKNLRKNGEI